MRAHTITTKASTIVSGGILALSLAVVLLAATASTASADRTLYAVGLPAASDAATAFSSSPECL